MISREPGYLQATQTSTASKFGYINGDQDLIRSAFQTGNFQAIRRLPRSLRHQAVVEAQLNHATNNLNLPGVPRRNVQRRALFSTFVFYPDPASLVEKLKTEAREEERKKMNPVPFRHTSHHPKRDKDSKDAIYTENFHFRDPYDDQKIKKIKEAWEEKRKILCGAFVPQAGQVKKIWKDLPSMVQELANVIENDWDDVDFSLYVDDEQLIIIYFEIDANEGNEEAAAFDRKAILAYMNHLASFDAVTSENGLTRVSELWNHTPQSDGKIFYAFKPPWIHRKLKNSYFALHPEAQTYQAQKLHRDEIRRKALDKKQMEKESIIEERQLRMEELLRTKKTLVQDLHSPTF